MSAETNRISVLGQIRESLAALRELAIITAIGLLVAWPSLVKSSLERAGIRSVAGLEFDWEQLADANEEAHVVEQTVNEVVGELETVSQQLNLLATQTRPDANKLRDLSLTVARLENRAREADASLSRSIASHDRIIKKLPPGSRGHNTKHDVGSQRKVSRSPKGQSITR